MTVDMNLINTLVGLVSLIMGGFAIWLSVHFYNQAKESEKQTSNLLARIEAQVDMLKGITAKQMSQLIRNVTDVKPIDENILQIIAMIRPSPDSDNDIKLRDAQIEQLTGEAITAYIAAFFYSSVTNVFAQMQLPSKEKYAENFAWSDAVKNLVDSSHKDVEILRGILSKVHQTRLEANSVYHLYQDAVSRWLPHVKNSFAYFSDQEGVS